VSAGTERAMMELARKSLMGKAKARPDLIKQVLAKIKTEGLGQTLHKVFAKLDTPVALGYSCAGTVEAVGQSMSGIRPGDRVACGGAGYATHAEYNCVPRNLCARVPDGVSFEDASFATIGAIAMQGVRQSDVRLGERVVVIGLGLIGLLTVQVLKAGGCQVLGNDPNEGRCALAEELGADGIATGDVLEAAAAFTDGHGADAVIITAATPSNQPIETAAEISRVKGRVVVVGMVGMNVPREPFYNKELDLRLSMSYGPGRYDAGYEQDGHDYPFGYVRWTEQRNMQSFLKLVAAGKITPSKLITHRFPIDQALHAYALLNGRGPEGNPEPYLGILIEYPQGEDVRRSQRTIEIRRLSPTDRLGVGFIGAGNFAKAVLLPALKRFADVDPIGICTATGMSGTETGRKHGFAYATTDYERILADDRINTVFVATRHDTHARLACAALAAGKHVFVEKPLCVKPEEIERYEEALAGSDQGGSPCLMVGFNRRFSPHAVALRQAFADRRTPMILTYRVNAGAVPRDSWVHDPEIGGGRIVGEVCHFVDFCEFVTGSVPVSVFAKCINSQDARITSGDSVVITIAYADGSLCTIQYIALGAFRLAKERIEIYADGATALLDNFVRTAFHGIKQRSLRGKQDKGFASEVTAFLHAAQTGAKWPISFESLVRTTRVTFAVNESLRSGRSIPVEG
ncbi:MAG: bi-domain-containing oxidoreductase, partial [bacterium]